MILKYVKNEENARDYSTRHPNKDLLKVEEFLHYVNFVADDATLNALSLYMIKKATKNDKLLHQVIKLARLNLPNSINHWQEL